MVTTNSGSATPNTAARLGLGVVQTGRASSSDSPSRRIRPVTAATATPTARVAITA